MQFERIFTLQNCLWIWQIAGIVLIIQDPTLSPTLKFIGFIVNFSFFLYITSNIFKQAINILSYGIAFMILCWYIYYTPIDITNPGYTLWQKIFYGMIDIASIIYLIGSILLLTINKVNKYLDLPLPLHILQRFVGVKTL